MISLINFINLTLQEKIMILSWRNNPNIKKWMYNSDNISLNSHLDYIKSLNIQKDRIYFLVKKQNNYIGVVDLTSINYKKKEAEIGLYSNPNINGNGKIIANAIIDYAFKKLKLKRLLANVYLENDIAFNLYKDLNFEELKRDEKLIYMELCSEDR